MKKSSKTTGSVKIHEAASISPDMSEDEYQELLADIRENGLIHKVVMLGSSFVKAELLDGRHRYRALQELGLKLQPNSKLLLPKDVPDPLAYVISSSKRRNLTVGQKAMMAARYATMTVGRQSKSNGSIEPIKSNQQAADALGIGASRVKEAKKVEADGALALKKAVESGAVSVSAAAIVSELPKAEQVKLVKEGPKAIAAEASKIRSEKKAAAAEPEKKPEPEPERESQFKPEEFDPEMKEDKPKAKPTIDRAKFDQKLSKLKGDIHSLFASLGPFVRTLDDVHAAVKLKNHKVILASYQRLYGEIEQAKSTLIQLERAWNASEK